MSGTSTTNADPGAVSTFVTLRFSGDRLEPNRITHILAVQPTLAYRKGEPYRPSPNGAETTGRTGVWYLSTRRVVKNASLAEHLRYLIGILTPKGREARLLYLRDLMNRDGLEADASCFWHGKRGARAPEIPAEVTATFSRLPATLEIDFDTD
jgi:Domain of unknown function (DUF4279)